MYKLLEINEQNFHFLSDFINLNNNKFDIIINTEYTNIIQLIKTKNIFIYTKFYFFKFRIMFRKYKFYVNGRL